MKRIILALIASASLAFGQAGPTYPASPYSQSLLKKVDIAGWTTGLGVTGSLVGTSQTQTLTGKTIDGGSNTITGITAGSITSLAWSQITATPSTALGYGITNGSVIDAWGGKAVPTGVVVGTTDSQTLTNKTLTSPAISTPTGIVKGDVGLGNVDNTSDANKPVSTATQTALNLKEDASAVSGHVLAAILAGLPADNGNAVTSSDSVLIGFGKLNKRLSDYITTNDAAVAGKAPTAGSTSIVTLGTVTTGTWNATAIDATHGGTAQTSYATGDTLYASASNTISKLSGNTTTTNKYLSQTGTGSASQAPVWSDFSGGVRSVLLTGLSTSTATPVVAGDTILAAIGKLQGQRGFTFLTVEKSDGTKTYFIPTTTGATDMGTALVSAVSSLSSNSTLYIPPGTYQITPATNAAPLSITSLDHVEVIGRGYPTIYGAGEGDFFKIDTCTSVTIRGVVFKGNKPSRTALYCAIRFYNVNDIALIEDCQFIDLADQAIAQFSDKTSTNVTVSKCYFNNVGSWLSSPQDGACVAGIGSNQRIINCYALNCNRFVEIEGITGGSTYIQNVTVSGNQAIGMKDWCFAVAPGTTVDGSHYTDMLIENNIFNDCIAAGNGSGAPVGLTGQRISFIGNTINNCTANAVAVSTSGISSTSDLTIKMNRISNIVTGGGIYLGSGVSGLTITGVDISLNKLHTISGTPIRVDGGAHVTIGNNMIDGGASTYGIYSQSASQLVTTLVIKDNQIFSTSRGISVNNTAGAVTGTLILRNVIDSTTGGGEIDDAGTSTVRWGNTNGAGALLENTFPLLQTFTAGILPGTDGTVDNSSTSKRWQSTYTKTVYTDALRFSSINSTTAAQGQLSEGTTSDAYFELKLTADNAKNPGFTFVENGTNFLGSIGYKNNSGSPRMGIFAGTNSWAAGFMASGIILQGKLGGMNVGDNVPGASWDVNNTADNIGLLIRGNATQTTNLLRIQKSDTTLLTSIDNAGVATFSGGVTGVTTNSSASAGIIGEYVSSTVVAGSAVSLTTATTANVTSISLTAGDWDVSYDVYFVETGVTATEFDSSISTTTAVLSTTPGQFITDPSIDTALTGTKTHAQGATRQSLSGTTTIYLPAQATFSVGTVAAYGIIRARRIR